MRTRCTRCTRDKRSGFRRQFESRVEKRRCSVLDSVARQSPSTSHVRSTCSEQCSASIIAHVYSTCPPLFAGGGGGGGYSDELSRDASVRRYATLPLNAPPLNLLAVTNSLFKMPLFFPVADFHAYSRKSRPDKWPS